jgi:hypothetical protein
MAFQRNPEKEMQRLETELHQGNTDLSADYMAVNALQDLIHEYPEAVRETTISALREVLETPVHSAQTQSYFLYRSAADTLASIVSDDVKSSRSISAMDSLKRIIGKKPGNQHRAAAEALGSLFLKINGPRCDPKPRGTCPVVRWERLLSLLQGAAIQEPEVYGRSIVSDIEDGTDVFVVKLASGDDSGQALLTEAAWMAHFHQHGYEMNVPFHIPRPLIVDGSRLFKVKNIPVKSIERNGTVYKDGCYGIGFIAPKNYFRYPNDDNGENGLTPEDFRKTIFQNAWLLGRLASLGIVHTAPIPLFHNRIQRNRREDHGLYEWPRGGRLDRWLDSCRFPNFGLTGVRDFEHFSTFPNPCKNLYQWIGTHLLSLLLVCGSYFRNQDTCRIGMDPEGNPVDVRVLFDKALLAELARGIFDRYYNGFTGVAFAGEFPVDPACLAAAMIEEMGVDRYMEEILRLADQLEMPEKAFRTLLRDAGFSSDAAEEIQKGEGDIVLHTGPHLGGFNDRISLPELIHFLETASALCVAGRHEAEGKDHL